MKRILLISLVLTFILAGCGGEAEIVNTTPDAVDAATGLPLNPNTIPDGPFIVEGTIANMNLSPQSAPEFVVRIPSGKTYRIRSQALSDITYDDGESVTVDGFSQGLLVRATVEQQVGTVGTGDVPILFSSDLVIVRDN
ncbi:MAG: hypothetical protein Kow0080_11100 [Candidatus Promineifilaceae bacterium]